MPSLINWSLIWPPTSGAMNIMIVGLMVGIFLAAVTALSKGFGNG
jgi:hypothetical protein